MDVVLIIYFFKEIVLVIILVLVMFLVFMVMFVLVKYLLVLCMWVVMYMIIYRLMFVFFCGYKFVRVGKLYFEKYWLINYLKFVENFDV